MTPTFDLSALGGLGIVGAIIAAALFWIVGIRWGGLRWIF